MIHFCHLQAMIPYYKYRSEEVVIDVDIHSLFIAIFTKKSKE